MNNSQLWGLARTCLTVLGTWLGNYLVQKGYLTADQLTTVSGFFQQLAVALVPVIPIAASVIGTLYANSRNSKIASTAALPNVQKIVTDEKTATTIPSTKVVSE